MRRKKILGMERNGRIFCFAVDGEIFGLILKVLDFFWEFFEFFKWNLGKSFDIKFIHD